MGPADVLTTLGLPEDPYALLAEHTRALDEAYREVGGRLAKRGITWLNAINDRGTGTGACPCRVSLT